MKSFIDELKQDRNIIKDNTLKIRDYLIENCIKNIKIINASGGTSYLYEIPSFIIGYPVYNIEKITKLINKKLKEMKLTTILSNINTIYISWAKNVN